MTVRIGRYYDAKLDRYIMLSPSGMYGTGMHSFILDEIEYGARVAMALDEEDQSWWVLNPGPGQISRIEWYVIDEEPGGERHAKH